MTTLTNVLNLPTAIASAVAHDDYTAGAADISCTGLIAPARQRELFRRHADEIAEDVSDRIWSLVGQIGHGILERARDPDAIREKRLFIRRHGWVVSGKFDTLLLDGSALCDFKFTSVYTVKDGAKPEHEKQLNIYKLMVEDNATLLGLPEGHRIDRLQIIAVLRDWSKTKSRTSSYYPPHQVQVVDVPAWPRAQTEAYIAERIAEHKAAREALPDCSAEERWERGGTFALYKEGNQRATSVHDTRDEADAAFAEAQKNAKKGAVYTIKELPPVQIRCSDYCSASPFCDQFARIRNPFDV